MEALLFSYYPREDLEALLGALHACTDLHIELLDESGKTLLSFGEPAAFCLRAAPFRAPGDGCAREHADSALRAIELGEPYIFCCHSGLYHISYPLVTRERLFGSVLMGPFLMEEPDEDLADYLAGAERIPPDSMLALYRDAQSLRVFPPERIVQISRLLYYLVNSLVSGSRELQKTNREKLLHQSRVSESIQKYKQTEPDREKRYPLEEEKQLLSLVRAGKLEEARTAFQELLGRLLIYEKYSVDNMKLRMVELCALLARTSIERGAEAGAVLELSKKLSDRIISARNLNEIGYVLLDNLEIFTESLFFASDRNNRTVRRATEYIHAHFPESLSLALLAEELGVSASYLSMLFRQVTGLTFRDYLNTVRVDEAKRLLANTDYSIMDIAIACGFNDQSYFTKVFKKQTGLAPKQFR